MNFIWLIFVLLYWANSHAAGPLELSQLALDHSSAVSAQELEARALGSDAQSKGRWQNPQVLGQFGSLRSGSSQGSTMELSLTQPVPLSDKLSLRREISQFAVKNQKVRTEFYKQWVSHQAILAGWKLSINRELLEHGKERTRRIGLVKKYLETRPRVTPKQRVELSLLTSTLYQLETMLAEKKYDFEVAKGELEFWTGKPASEIELSLSVPDKYNFKNDTEVQIAQDPDVLEAKNNLSASKLETELAGKEKRPDLFLGGGYRVENVSPVNHFSYAIVGINIPLWDTGVDRLTTARLRDQKQDRLLEEVSRQAQLKQLKQIQLLNLSMEKLKLFPKHRIQQSEAAILEAENGFRHGLVDVNTFLLAETQAHEVIDQVFLSWLTYLENLSQLQLMRQEEFRWEASL